MKIGIVKGLAIGSTGLSFAIWAFLAWYGSHLVMYKGESGGRIYAAGLFYVFGGLSLGMALPEVKYFTEASVAASRIFSRIDRGKIDNCGRNLEKLSGRIEIKKVDFAYPDRPKTPILREFCLEVKAGSSIGLVGKSGSGKSTIVALIERFYDVDRGSIRVDGMDIKSFDIGWYRRQMALVSQEPVIYTGTIRDNILFGKPDASEHETIEAAKAANAHEFISQNGYDTECSERGVQLSGRQKQRIAIARAIIRNPTILLLDEATSALDVESEQVVQEALDGIMVGRTTVVVAHRLNTIKNLDSIALVSEGKVMEHGTYSQHKNKRGQFFNLVNLQNN